MLIMYEPINPADGPVRDAVTEQWWEPGESKDIDDEDAMRLLSNPNFKAGEPPGRGKVSLFKEE